MNNKVYLKEWEIIDNNTVKLTYYDGDEVFVKKTKFDEAFGPIIASEKQEVIRDFAISIQAS